MEIGFPPHSLEGNLLTLQLLQNWVGVFLICLKNGDEFFFLLFCPSFFAAPIKSGHSATWKAILEPRHLLSNGNEPLVMVSISLPGLIFGSFFLYSIPLMSQNSNIGWDLKVCNLFNMVVGMRKILEKLCFHLLVKRIDYPISV